MSPDEVVELAKRITVEGLPTLAREILRSGVYSQHLGKKEVHLFGHEIVVGDVSEFFFAGVTWVKIVEEDGEVHIQSPSSIYGFRDITSCVVRRDLHEMDENDREVENQYTQYRVEFLNRSGTCLRCDSQDVDLHSSGDLDIGIEVCESCIDEAIGMIESTEQHREFDTGFAESDIPF